MAKLTPAEIRNLSSKIDAFVTDLKDDYIKVLSKLVDKSYKDGISNAEREDGVKLKYSGMKMVNSTIDKTKQDTFNRIIPVLDTYKKELTLTLKDCVAKSLNFKDTVTKLDEKSRYLEINIPFNSVGKTYTKPEVINGKLVDSKHTITKRKTMSTSSYFDMLSKEISKKAYLMSKTYSYIDKGYKFCKYVTKRDNKVRKTHKAMNGRTAKIGSPEFEKFIALQLEYGCRCNLIKSKK